ncbi:BTB/POZ domain [Popillia japonica]|uniref:BTB/POZ domain n=1 Tax=Popillia japonica TaxID=7064 RepID=A0AAW1LRQ5_POPJA
MNLKKEIETSKTRYCVQYDDHSRMMCSVLCSLMEHQSLVDLAIRCGNSTIHAHKCVLAANSPYFREQLEKNPTIEQIVINGLDFTVVKSIVEFMYCGETNVIEENFKYMVAASKLFQIRGIQALAADDHYDADENIQIPAPLFLSKKPKYSSTYFPVNHLNISAQPNTEKVNIPADPGFHRRLKRKYMRSEAEKACAKEAAASRLALEALQKELATTDQMSSFVIEESCTETTVENFIPHGEEPFMDNLNQLESVPLQVLESVPLQVVNYADLNQTVLNNAGQLINVGKPILANTILHYDNLNNPQKAPESAAEKLKQILGGDIPSNVEIMFKTSDGNFVSLTDEVLQNITRESLQYQVIDEHGRAGEVQQLTINIKDPVVQNNAFNSA